MRLPELIRAEIAAKGPVPLARFMELALYHPEHGYYARAESPIGRRGDFFTSVSVGSAFGELLAARFTGWLASFGGPVQLVEAGAHDGCLAGDLLRRLVETQPALAARLEYWIIEPLPQRRQQQGATLAPWVGRVRWFANWAEVASPVRGVVFANELLDAMPVQRWAWDGLACEWQAMGVGLDGDRFTWTRMPGDWTGSSQPALPSGLARVLPDGYVTETSPAAVEWWRAAANRLERGWLVAIDYGDDEWQRWSPARLAGTFRGYHAQRQTPDPLADPGSQDLTAHVDFAAIRHAGEAAGLRTEENCSQEQFLAGILRDIERTGDDTANWTPAKRRQVVTLLHPNHLGRAFRVLVQGR